MTTIVTHPKESSKTRVYVHVTEERRQLEEHQEWGEEHEYHEGLEVVEYCTLRQPAHYYLYIVHEGNEDAIILTFNPWHRPAFGSTADNFVSKELLREFAAQLRKYFNCPSTEEVILKSTKAVVTAILCLLGFNNRRYPLQQRTPTTMAAQDRQGRGR